MLKLLFWLIPACLLAQQSSEPLTDGRIMGLAQAGVSQAELLRMVTTAQHFDFNLQPGATDAMAKAGVSEEVIRAMAARESGKEAAPSDPVQITSKDWILHEGTPVRIRIMRTVSSSTAQEGDNVDFQTLDVITVNGVIVVPRGTSVLATITSAEAKKRMARGGKLAMNVDYLRLPTGEKLPLRGTQNLKGGGHVGAMTGAMVATALIVWPAAPLFLFMHGKDIAIPEGRETTVYTNSDYKVEPARF